MKTKKYKKLYNFLKGFICINGIIGGFIFWLLFGIYLITILLSNFEFDFSRLFLFLKIEAGVLIIISIPVAINFGVYCAKHYNRR